MKMDDQSLRGLSLTRLLADPLIKMVMASDGVVEGDILDLARRHQARRPAEHVSFAPRQNDRGGPCAMMA